MFFIEEIVDCQLLVVELVVELELVALDVILIFIES